MLGAPFDALLHCRHTSHYQCHASEFLLATLFLDAPFDEMCVRVTAGSRGYLVAFGRKQFKSNGTNQKRMMKTTAGSAAAAAAGGSTKSGSKKK